MTRIPIPCLLSTALLLGCTGPAFAASNDPGRIADAILAAQHEMSGVPGMGAAMVRDGKVIWAGSAGQRDADRALPVTPATSFRLASVSKLLTATAAMRLYAQGRLDLDAQVQADVPGLSRAWPSISARQLAAHTSGLPHYQAVDAFRGGRHFDTVSDAVKLFADRPLRSAPGDKYEYSSWGYTLLSAAVEARAGRPFIDYVAHDLTTGLAIRPDRGRAQANDSLAYEVEGGVLRRAPAHDYSYSWGGAGFRGTPSAVAMFGARVMSPSFLSPKARELMWTPARLGDGSVAGERDFAVGVGWRIGRDGDGAQIVHHAGATLGARSVLVGYPDSGDNVSLLSNASWVSSIERTAIMLAAPFRTAPAGRDCPTDAARYEGSFGGEPISGSIRFAVVEGICRGSLVTRGTALGRWLTGQARRLDDEMLVIAVTADGRLGRAALVTPIGSFDLRRQTNGGLAASMGVDRDLLLRLRPSA